MKKILALVFLVLMLAISLVGCGAPTPVGSWTITADGVSMEFTVEKDGKGKISAGELKADMEWAVEDGLLDAKMSIDGENQLLFEDAEFSVDGDELTITYQGSTNVLTKKK